MTRDEYLEQRHVIVSDLKWKLKREDWHGVSDAANDLRELDAFWRGLMLTEKARV